ncbi:right-handed parallel beta-helix repeat-containing protein [Pyxidicoccus xibeiensis]|uniref:right-handed parallel beta-helix repeat-containing protein n=1 Tax=Pyxidicoccus xibeiensis TaxID=2906759 RepID=UPI0020A70287|nr:right-handed parallel beta-helix repeat-containing protein [Pyxidicoccus xibeiensis]MCP3137099.1 right-handed parallel beta-helix repeat-containing protein [Pyxidicoccus xibeiensis]
MRRMTVPTKTCWTLLLLLAATPAVAQQPPAPDTDDGIGAQVRPDLSFAELKPRRVFHVAITGNDGNPGTEQRPWRTVRNAVTRLRPGDAVLVHEGTYVERVDIGGAARDGLPDAPIQLLAAPGERPVLRGGDGKTTPMLRIARSYWVVDGLDIQAAGSQAHGIRFQGARHVVVRNSEVSGGTGPAAVTFYGGAADIGFLRNLVHDYRWGASKDSHGLLVQPDTARILIQGNEAWSNGGDSFQCQGPDTTPGTSIPVDITVEGNRFHEDRENAVDIKTCERVTIRNNKFFGYRPATTAPQGAAMVVHYSARRILIEGNRVWDSGRGLSLGGNMVLKEPVTDVIVRRNIVFNGTTDKGGSGDGLRVGTSRRVRLYHNTLAFLPVGGIKLGDGDHGPAHALRVQGNIIYSAPRALEVRSSGVRDFVSDRNLAFRPGGDIVFRWDGKDSSLAGWKQRSGQDVQSRVADPLFVRDPVRQDFFTQVGSPARNAGDPRLPGNGTFCGAAPDLGFLESCTGEPPPSVSRARARTPAPSGRAVPGRRQPGTR